MVPNINTRGTSFKGVTQYVLHDIEKIERTAESGNKYTEHRHLESSNRVGFTETANMHTDDIEKAAKVMAWTDENREYLRGNGAGRKASAGNVYHYSIAWKDGQDPDAEHMKQAAHESVKRLGLDEHQYYMVEHTDEDHKHVHIVVNLVHPETGKIANVRADYKTLDKWANEYEQENGIVCENRAKKYQDWEQDKPAFTEKERREHYKQAATQAYNQSDNGQAFVSALEGEGLSLARGNKRGFVVVDEQGEIYALNRLVEGAKAKDVNARLKGVDREALPMADKLAQERAEQYQQEEQQRQEQAAQALDMLADIVADELEEERNLYHDHDTAQTAVDNAQGLDEYALQDLSLWNGDNNEAGTGNNGQHDLSFNPFPDSLEHSGMQQVSGQDGSRGSSQGEGSTTSGEIQNNAGSVGGSGEQKALAEGDKVRALDWGNVGTVQSVDGDNISVLFTNKKTGRSKEAVYSPEGLQLYKKAPVNDLQKEQASQEDEERARRLASIQRRIDEKTAQSREKWGIDELQTKVQRAEKQAAQARAEFEQNNTFVKRLFKGSTVRALREDMHNKQDAAEAIQATLNERLKRFEDDIEAFNKNRPARIRQAEIDKHINGIEDAGDSSEGVKQSTENKTLQEAQSSPEAAARLSDQVQAKTPKQSAAVAQVRQKAEDYKAEKTAAHNREVEAREDKQQKRQKPHYSAAQVLEYQKQQQALYVVCQVSTWHTTYSVFGDLVQVVPCALLRQGFGVFVT